jgi:CHASE2 domain-containing sensor protein
MLSMHRMDIPDPLRLVLLGLAGLYAVSFAVLVAAGTWTPDQVAIPTAVAAFVALVALWRRPEVAVARRRS